MELFPGIIGQTPIELEPILFRNFIDFIDSTCIEFMIQQWNKFDKKNRKLRSCCLITKLRRKLGKMAKLIYQCVIFSTFICSMRQYEMSSISEKLIAAMNIFLLNPKYNDDFPIIHYILRGLYYISPYVGLKNVIRNSPVFKSCANINTQLSCIKYQLQKY